MNSKRGMTLLEILVVLALVAGFISFALPKFQSGFDVHLKKQARMLAGTIQYLYNYAVMKHKTVRLRYNLADHSYKVESTSSQISLDQAEGENRGQKKESPFKDDTTFIKKPVKLEKRVQFKDIKTEAREEPITSGEAFTHFFPHGYAEETKIRLINEKGKIYVIVVHPLTGNTKIYAEENQ